MEEKRRICLVKDDMSVTGGREKVLANMANALCEHFDVYVFCIWNKNGCPPPYPIDERVKWRQFLPGDMRLRQALPKAIKGLRAFLREERIDAALSIGVDTNIMLLRAVKGTNCKTVCCEHSNLYSELYGWWGHLNQRAAAKRADLTVCLTAQDADAYRAKFGMKPGRVTYHYNGAELAQGPGADVVQNRRILSVGRMEPVKNFAAALDVAARVLPDRPSWTWEICGDGPCYEELTGQVKALGLEGRVLLPGNVADLGTHYKEAALFVHTSRSEGLPMVFLEAAAHGLPIVSFDCKTGPREIVKDGKNGYLVPVDDIDKMTGRVKELMDSAEKRAAFGGGWQGELDKFAPAAVNARWRQLIDTVIEGRNS